MPGPDGLDVPGPALFGERSFIAAELVVRLGAVLVAAGVVGDYQPARTPHTAEITPNLTTRRQARTHHNVATQG